jgi:predicted CXXCH cytochrome family protein
MASALVANAVGWAQEFDAVVSDQNRRETTILDEIADPGERRAFQALYEERDPAKRLKLAEGFLGAYPQSGVLAAVYEVAAKASIEFGDYRRGLEYASASLKLLPENPLLLVSVADVQARMNLSQQPEQSAHEALEDLDRFDRPASIPKQAWPDLKRQLEASCYFVLGRVAASEALRPSAGKPDRELLLRSAGYLAQARRLNPNDPEIPYLRGLTCLALGRQDEASVDFANASRLGGSMQSQALAQLRKIYRTQAKPGTTFEAFLARVAAQTEAFPVTEQANNKPPEKLPDYAGSQTCRVCHAGIYSDWSRTGMARMFHPYRPEEVLGDFTSANEFYDGDEVRWEEGRVEVIPGKTRSLFARMILDHGRHYFEIRQSDGWQRYPVDYAIGSKWEQAYATRLPSGEIHVFPIQYNVLARRWVNFWKIIDSPGSPRADLRHWEKLDVWTSYQANCAVCHTSQLRNVKGGAFEPANLEFREAGIGCEMCHGPSTRHVQSILNGEPYPKRPIDPPVDFAKIGARDFIAICAQCHMQSAIREPGPGGELNYSTEGEFFKHPLMRPYTEFSRKGFYKDGRFRETTFIVESLLRSECFKKGSVTCGSCHDPHGPDVRSNLASLKFRDRPDQMCLQCHSRYSDRATLEHHTRHSVASEASRCVSCHMPRIMDALLFEARTHQIDDIPNAGMTLRFGQDESPNACLICHRDKDAHWVERQLPAWKRG